MPAAVLTHTEPEWQQDTRIETFDAHQRAVTPSGEGMTRLVSCYDSVTFDFSDWKHEQLNENTTAFYWSIPEGSLDISCYNLSNETLTDDVHAASLVVDGENPQSSKDVIAIHDWCVEQARSEHSYVSGQRFFRFERGRYASSLPFPGLKMMQMAIKDYLDSVRSR
ncbi:hypothetical protein F5Y16DRAFT_357038 [Xylariaceae sp. FL0255]|nr:hypothetical protein F5Y16DRAFT_357038 [Xylariaceae sp. FL0255]